MEVKALKREFVVKDTGTVLPDIDPEMTAEQVQQFYSGQYPQLTVATCEKRFTGDKWVYTFKSTLGTKG
ncbi:PRTRC system protein C [Dysgonomonas sp. GY75]|uniref:PRTRC system protein C n=1 Tax=Dysgonomonas sp. GY75 TaxID=2780419 RepID=UPI001883C265|nr:PRTRC system protein C [Dysgonomonas sp. GY75]MBF0650807.1 PRTRC system protein C [Dysgonomonas sp. GY75]